MSENGRVTARGGLRLRDSPRDGRILALLDRGAQVEVLERETWLRVRADGQEGFVSADFVEPDREGDAPGPEGRLSLVSFSSPSFIGEPVRADTDFVPFLELLATWAAELSVQVFVTSSFRRPGARLRNTVVEPARGSNHLVGHAIDMNLQSAEGFFNSSALARDDLSSLPPDVKRFLDRVREHDSLRWGGDFSQEDPVHIDDGLNVRDPDAWAEKFRLA